MIAFGKAAHCLREIERAKTNLDCAPLHAAVFHDPCLIDKQGACRHEQNIFMSAGNDVHLSGHPRHEVVGRLLHFEHDGVALRFRIRRRLDGGNPGRELLCAIGIQLQDRFHSWFHFANVFLVYFAAHVVLARGHREKFISLRHQFAIDRLDVGEKSVDSRTDFGVFHLRLEFFARFIEHL